jgi:hypothetical protein
MKSAKKPPLQPIVGGNSMKLLSKLMLAPLSAVMMISAVNVEADTLLGTESIKFHVALYGGEETIYFAVLKAGEMQKLPDSLPGRNISTSLAIQSKKVKGVFECTLLNSKFKQGRAQKVDKLTAR